MSSDLDDGASMAANRCVGASCGGQNFRDASATWTLTVAGQYRFTLTAEFDTVLYLADEASGCATELACVDASGPGAPEIATVDLGAGQTVRMFIDGKAGPYGPYELKVEAL